MKKLLFILGFSILLTACGQVGQETVVQQPSPDGIEVDHGSVFGRVTFIDENSVSFTTDLQDSGVESGPNTYALSKDVVIKVMEGEQLVELPRERAMDISFSSNSNDYLFYFVLTDTEVLSMTQAVLPEEHHDEATDDLVYVIDVYERYGEYFVVVDPMEFLACTDCPNGYERQNQLEERIHYEVPVGRTPFFVINWGTSIVSAYPMDFADFQAKFEKEKENFGVIPYHLKIDGTQVLSLTEKYIP